MLDLYVNRVLCVRYSGCHSQVLACPISVLPGTIFVAHIRSDLRKDINDLRTEINDPRTDINDLRTGIKCLKYVVDTTLYDIFYFSKSTDSLSHNATVLDAQNDLQSAADSITCGAILPQWLLKPSKSNSIKFTVKQSILQQLIITANGVLLPSCLV